MTSQTTSSPAASGPRIGRSYQESVPWYPPRVSNDRPNVVVILFDDLGFADFGCYGSEIRTPHIDSLAAAGLRYNNFHTTTLCSPSRACLLTGRNHHSVGMRMLSNVDSGWPSGRGQITRSAALLSEVLKDEGYDPLCVGKWHVAPMREAGPGGPFDEWPLGRGFNRFYGFMNGSADHFYPELVYDNHCVDPPALPTEGYHLTDDLVDKARLFLSDHVAHRPDDPFFLYLPLGAAHAPHHAPVEAMEAVRGRYDEGWDVVRAKRYERQLAEGVIPGGTQLAPANPDVQPWDSLSADEQRLAARLQEAYAAMVEHTDAALGRLFEHLHTIGAYDDTLIILTSDNGAAMEGGRLGTFSRIQFFNDLEPDLAEMLDQIDDIGGPLADNHYARGWAQASNTPSRWYKYHTHGGGVRDPLVVSWPNQLARPGSVLQQFHHIIDIAPTIYEVAGIHPPATYGGVSQMPLHGTSFAYTFTDPDAPTRREVQYFEMFGNRGLWAEGWKAVTHHAKGDQYPDAEWELYHLDGDFSECDNLADREPDRLRQLTDLWWREAGRYDVLPLDDRSVELFRAPPTPGSALDRTVFNYFPPVSHVEPSAAPPVRRSSHRIEVDIAAPGEGVLVAYGNVSSGFVLYIDGSALRYEYNAGGVLAGGELMLPTERNSLRAGVEVDRSSEPARFRLFAGATFGDWVQFARVFDFLALAGLDIGRDSLSPCSSSYVAPNAFTGVIARVRFRLDDRRPPDRDLLDD